MSATAAGVGVPMWKQGRTARSADTSLTPGPGDPAESRVLGGGDATPIGQVVRPWALQALVAAYGGDTYRLLTDLADVVEASIAYVDRPTVEAHLERSLTDDEWSRVAAQFTAMAFDEHVGDAGMLRTDWIEDRLHRAGVPGRGLGASGRSGPSRQPMRR
ncbi:hypothetical protein [Blastococcus sp. PRF04-17]|uniref:hypothetical protein n=1 Tax=Blastococcus sp. PRF04-17 TaxID=2933797 RepID=UPI001FF22CEB|nr:hypothetical protein [Blastococcus sp. PRF04-17]UOY03173.1 hypothetical protein MVA48_07455 [Blastococcus sp. PRF04-17]